MTTSKWLYKNIPSLSGKIVAISGSTGGLGQALCEHLATLGASLLLLDRNEQKAQALIDKLRKKIPSLRASYIYLDLSDIDCVAEVTKYLCKNTPDHIIFNAGIYHVPRYTCKCGYNNIFQVNFLSPYYMARKLKPYIQGKGGNIVAVGSIAHNYSKIDIDDIDFSTRAKSSKIYGNSKRFLMFSLYGLFGEEAGLSIVHPGITFTNITAHYPKVIFALIKHPMKIIFMSPKKASLSILQGLNAPCETNTWIGPRVFDVWGVPKKKLLKTCSFEESRQICEIAETAYEKMDAIINKSRD
ncbi:MAG: SDR family NAD(P)-dependent oxidoreductase [Ruminococcaceae bacterium]|nr:SDR family NAD(P)-dependent oxidoreductase [Oscillospiraceae bacterium]